MLAVTQLCSSKDTHRAPTDPMRSSARGSNLFCFLPTDCRGKDTAVVREVTLYETGFLGTSTARELRNNVYCGQPSGLSFPSRDPVTRTHKVLCRWAAQEPEAGLTYMGSSWKIAYSLDLHMGLVGSVLNFIVHHA